MGICRYCALAPAACGRELTDVPLFPLPLLFIDTLCPARTRRSLNYLRFRRGESSAQDAQPAAGPCVISGAIPYSVPTMICSRLAPRSRWISFIGVRVCPTSIYRCGVSCTEYSQHHKSPARMASSRCQTFRALSLSSALVLTFFAPPENENLSVGHARGSLCSRLNRVGG